MSLPLGSILDHKQCSCLFSYDSLRLEFLISSQTFSFSVPALTCLPHTQTSVPKHRDWALYSCLPFLWVIVWWSDFPYTYSHPFVVIPPPTEGHLSLLTAKESISPVAVTSLWGSSPCLPFVRCRLEDQPLLGICCFTQRKGIVFWFSHVVSPKAFPGAGCIMSQWSKQVVCPKPMSVRKPPPWGWGAFPVMVMDNHVLCLYGGGHINKWYTALQCACQIKWTHAAERDLKELSVLLHLLDIAISDHSPSDTASQCEDSGLIESQWEQRPIEQVPVRDMILG